MAVAVVPYAVNVPYGIFELEGNQILGISEKPKYNYYANAGIYLLKRELIDLIPEGKHFDVIDMINLLVSKSKTVVRYLLTGYWIDIGTQADYIKAQEIVKHIR
jgi:NDP-sugar pyrophosphorylase family protein